MNWYENRDEVIGLAEWLESESCFPSIDACIRYFEKPWHWTREFELWQLWLDVTDPFLREQIVEAVDDGQNAEDFKSDMEDALS